jgi:NifU-like protein
MSRKALTMTFPWARYSLKLRSKIIKPRNVGFFSAKESEERGMRLITGFDGSVKDGNAVRLYWLVDPEDGIIVDAKFQAYGQSALIGAADIACELLVGKNYEQARRMGADLIDKQVRDKTNQPSFPWETSSHLNLVIGAIEEAASQCTDIPLKDTYIAPPAQVDMGEVLEGGYPGFDSLSSEEQAALIEQVLDQDIRPYIALDAGGVEVVKLEGGRELTIKYQGACTSCMSSVGATLYYIQQTLRNKVHPEITVVPEM